MIFSDHRFASRVRFRPLSLCAYHGSAHIQEDVLWCVLFANDIVFGG